VKKTFGAVIAAGGTGTRFGTDTPKQFVDLCGIPVIAHTIKHFENCKAITSIVIVAHKDYIVFCNDVVKHFGFSKISAIIEGGDTRQQSVFKGIKALDTDYVLIHDAARPVISDELVSLCCKEVATSGACAVGKKVVDTVKYSEDGKYISSTVDRSHLWQIQTPQCFEKDIILKCHKNAVFEKFTATDDCMLVENYDVKVKLIECDSSNIKLTNAVDLLIAEVLLRE